MIRPILAFDDPYASGEIFHSAGWRVDFSQPPESGDPLVGVSLEGNSLLLGVTEGYVPLEQRPYTGCGVQFYCTVPTERLEDIHTKHAPLHPGPIRSQPWGDLAFEVTIAGYHFMITAQRE